MADLNQLRNFVAIYRAGSVSLAARTRNLTQPAVSQQLAALEASVGQPLFVRTPRGMVPTERGKAFYAQIVESMDRLERVMRGLKRGAAHTPLLRLGLAPDYACSFALPRLRGLGSRVQIDLRDHRKQFVLLETGALDAVVNTARASGRGISHRVLGEKRFRLIAPADLPVPPQPDEAWLLEQAWISVGAELTLHRRVWQDWFGRNFTGEVALIVPELRAMLRAVELGFGLAFLPEFVCQEGVTQGRVKAVWPEHPIGPVDAFVLSYREVDGDRDEIQLLGDLLTERPGPREADPAVAWAAPAPM
ncbi:LysR family transcriptional regulator [Deinococcus hopiensis]|uniref:DNA-binding transcriptional regulator, LysR family n=1 Tax=Deinococcus hopiensis KR-140 TaxID=695939 RepID=A0A1W1VFM4_9DEIO|nr:LysR family transcriptional regulator [Deinococcus hopiensis]SMB92152.1 DNA-binding transcriptional regulator, LysR family [Deinococcus hopiensis KR-140]